MKNILYLAILLLLTTYACTPQKYTIGEAEKFDLELIKGKNSNVCIEENGWLKVVDIEARYIDEYAPVEDFYKISKNFYANGMLRSRGKQMGFVRFGKWEYFDTNGKLLKVVDEQDKFARLTPKKMVRFLKRKNIINTKNRTTIATGDTIYHTAAEFYDIIDKYFEIRSGSRKIINRKSIKRYFTWWIDHYGSKSIYRYIKNKKIRKIEKQEIELIYH